MNSRNSLGIGMCFLCAFFICTLVGCHVMDAQQPPSMQVVRGQSFERTSNTELNDSISLQERLKLLQQNRQERRSSSSSSTTPFFTNRNPLQTQNPSTDLPQYRPQYIPQYDARRELNSPYPSQQNSGAIQQASFEYQNRNGFLAREPVSNPLTTSPYPYDNPNRPDFVPLRNSDDTGFVPIPPALAPPSETPGRFNSPESVFNDLNNLNGVDGFSLVPGNQNPETSGSPGFGSNLDPNANLLLQQPAEEDIYQPSFLERMKHFYIQRGLIPQNSSASLTVIAGSTDDIGFFDLYIQTTFAVASVPGLTIAPSFQVDFLNGPTRTDLPPRLFNMGAEFRIAKPLTERMSYELAVRPAVFSDFEAGGSAAARVTGRGLGFYTWSTQTQLVFGLIYLDRKDLKLLPAIGLIHIPQGDWRLELIFPRPRILKLISRSGDAEKWGYLAGEFGGGSWAIERPRTVDDVVTYSDWRLIFGVQNKYANGRLWYFEVGLVFNRKLEYETGPGDYDPDSTGMIRAGIIY